MPKKQSEDGTFRIKLDLKPQEDHCQMFQTIMKYRGVTVNTEMVRILIKEEYDRVQEKTPLPIESPLYNEAEKFMQDHPELGYKNFDDLLRSALRRAIFDHQETH